MSYSIHYGPEKPSYLPKKKSYFGIIGAGIIVLIIAISIGWSIPEYSEQFVHALFPWTRSDVQYALGELSQNVREGQPMSDAVTAFCREIIQNAEQPK